MRKLWDEARLDALSETVRGAMERHVREVERRELTPLEAAALGRTGMNGVLEGLHKVAADSARDGAVGRLGFAGLADALGWPQSWFRVLVEALIVDGVVERIAGPGRLWLAGWDKEAPAHVHVYLARKGVCFANGARPKLGKLSLVERVKAEASFDRAAQVNAVERFKAPVVRTTVCAQTPRGESAHIRNISLKKISLGNSSVHVSTPNGRGDRGEGDVGARLGALLGPLMERRRREAAERLERVARDTVGYSDWWLGVMERCDAAGVLGDFMDSVDAVERGGIGVKSPGRFLTMKAKKLLMEMGQKLPPPPRLTHGVAA